METTNEKISVRERQYNAVMNSVDRYLMGIPKTRGENARSRMARVFESSDKVRAILDEANGGAPGADTTNTAAADTTDTGA